LGDIFPKNDWTQHAFNYDLFSHPIKNVSKVITSILIALFGGKNSEPIKNQKHQIGLNILAYSFVNYLKTAILEFFIILANLTRTK
jgi:hypothetical protein